MIHTTLNITHAHQHAHRQQQRLPPLSLLLTACSWLLVQRRVLELAFSWWYHRTPANQVLHLCTFVPIVALTASTLGWFGSFAAVALYSLLLGVCVDSVAGGSMLLLSVPTLAAVHWLLTPFAPLTRCGIALALAPLQLLGHVVFEGRLPAFRPFEALVTTPALLALVAVNAVTGVRRELLEDVVTCGRVPGAPHCLLSKDFIALTGREQRVH